MKGISQLDGTIPTTKLMLRQTIYQLISKKYSETKADSNRMLTYSEKASNRLELQLPSLSIY